MATQIKIRNHYFQRFNASKSAATTAEFTILAAVQLDDTTGNPVLDWFDGWNARTIINPTTLAAGRDKSGTKIVTVNGVDSYTPLSSRI
ncbi:MAG: hypothetical protein JKY27_12075 [Magnetovibrio sp.]|nr:hypothetical protein [Magnetovibrio sp.]